MKLLMTCLGLSLLCPLLLIANSFKSGEDPVLESPLVDLIVNPSRYDGHRIQTYGFIGKNEEGAWFITFSKEGLSYFDRLSVVWMNLNLGIDEKEGSLIGAFVVVNGRFTGGQIRKSPGEVFKVIQVNHMEIVGKSLEDRKIVKLQQHFGM